MSSTARVAIGLSMVAAGAGWIILSWHTAFVFGYLAVWFFAVERSVGVVRFVRFDPWRGKPARTRLLAYGLVTVTSVLVAGAFGWAIVRSESPGPILIVQFAVLTAYSVWAVAFVGTHAGDQTVATTE